MVRDWQNISVLIRASRCAGWQGRPELEQAAGIRVTGMGLLVPKLPDCRRQRGSTSTGLSLEISLGLAPTSAFLAIALFLKHYPCGIHPSFFFPSLSRKCANRESISVVTVNPIEMAASASDFARGPLKSALRCLRRVQTLTLQRLH